MTSLCAACPLVERVLRIENTAHTAFTDASRLKAELREGINDMRGSMLLQADSLSQLQEVCYQNSVKLDAILAWIEKQP